MRTCWGVFLALALASSLLMPVREVTYADIEQAMIPEARDMTRAARLRTAADPADPDTVWIGHIYVGSYTADGKMPAGGYGPYKVGRGSNFPTKQGSTIGDKAS